MDVRYRRIGITVGIVLSSLGGVGLSAAQARSEPAAAAGTTCTWGGTPAAPTGRFTISPGLTSLPLTAPARFFVTGDLGGGTGCRGTLTYIGQIDATGSCSFSTFEGRARGIPGVTRFAGVGAGPLGPARLYDDHGNVIASENASITTAENAPHFSDCDTPQGFTGGDFSSVIVFVASPGAHG